MTVTELILLGFSDDVKINTCLFLLFSIIYAITIFGNVLIMYVVFINPHLRTPMYFFLANLSFIDLCNASSTVPKLLVDLFSTYRNISLSACLIQFKVILLIGTTECNLLAIMAYDRYVAICHPLHYPVVMRWHICYWLTALLWLFSFTISVMPSIALPLVLCYPNQVDHFMCEILALLKLSCDDTRIKEIVISSLSFITLCPPFVFIVTSYVFIIHSVLKIQSTRRTKAFSTCSSHVMVVVLYFGTGIVTYFGQTDEDSINREKYTSVFYVVVSPMLNPLIYSLNNREVKRTLVMEKRNSYTRRE
ncbi:olfactory receptor 11-like [Hyla sarda]|uniref:olfactory receptor 11-like n=1 Tax=Hyla sarda TaxID=327740 RepID=UPI0024C2D858|nr:olfactory receptor 11-like [Hyla sarda]